MIAQTSSIWRCRDHELQWGTRTLVMGIVNVTPDSFSDGGECFSSAKAIEKGYRLIDQGADMIDVGGESTRPGAEPVDSNEEMQRVLPVIQELAGRGKLAVSIDTTHYETACAALDAGACILNDISGLQQEPRLAGLASQSGAGLVVMHMRGTAQTMQTHTRYEDLIADIRLFLARQVALAEQQGVNRSQICIDPGIGFSKTAEQNLILLHRLQHLCFDSIPMLLGVSRKSFIGRITGQADAKKRLAGTIAANTLGIIHGADILRVHDVQAAREAADTVQAVVQESFHF